MATGGTLVIKQGNDFVLYKVRHDGYALDEHFKDSKQAFIGNIDQVLQGFIDYYNKNYSHPGYEIETLYQNGFKFTDYNLNINSWVDFTDIVIEAESRIESVDPDDGYLCEYGVYVYIDLDSQQICGFLDSNDDYEVFDNSYVLINTIAQF